MLLRDMAGLFIYVTYNKWWAIEDESFARLEFRLHWLLFGYWHDYQPEILTTA